MLLLNDSSGNKSLTHTTALVGFVVVMVKVLLGGGSVSWGDHVLSFGTIDSFSIAAILTPTLGAYVARRYGNSGADDAQDAGSKPNGG